MTSLEAVPEQALDRSRIVALLEVSLAVVFWGASFIATKIALRQVSPITVVWLRFGMGVVVLGIAMRARRQFALVPGRDLAYFALLGLLGVTFHQWLQSNGLVTSQATTTAWIVATTPIFIALLGWLFLRERLGLRRVVGIALALIGVLLVVTRGDLRLLAAGRFGAPGDVLILISSVNWAVFSVLSRRGLREHPAVRMMFYVMALGWLFITALFFAGPGLGEIAQLTLPGWLSVGFLGLFCSGLAYIFWYDALKMIPASQVGVFLYVEPLVALGVAAALLDERLRFAALLGGGIILLGVWLVNRSPRAPRRE
ncbi:MAG: DMT family transporter [Chloroflexi bacterium]|nr:DMT family transporter [Chloroflexota bacterium]